MIKRLLLTLLVLSYSASFAADQISFENHIVSLKCKGISFIGSGITVDDAKKFAVNDAKRNALEQAGSYLESHMEMKDHMVTKDEIETYTAGILKTDILSSENKVIDGTFAIEVVIEAKIDTKYLEDRLNRIKDDTELRKMLEEQKKLNDRLTQEISDLKQQKTGYEKKSKDIAKSLEASDWFDRGFRAQECGKYEEALKHYAKALQYDPNIAQIYNNRGLVYYFLKDYSNAESNFDKAIELDPKLSMAYNNKAILSYERRNYGNAISYFNKVIDLDPTLEQTYYNRGFAYFKSEKIELCLNDLKEYLKLAGNKHGDETRINNFIKEQEAKLYAPEPEPEPEMVTVPNLYNTTESSAKKIIKDSGLELGIIHRVTDIDKGFDRVIGQSVRKGEEVKKGSVIDITVNEEAKDEGW